MEIKKELDYENLAVKVFTETCCESCICKTDKNNQDK